jgi:hypothetical protein
MPIAWPNHYEEGNASRVNKICLASAAGQKSEDQGGYLQGDITAFSGKEFL